jgi:hypothetical protein
MPGWIVRAPLVLGDALDLTLILLDMRFTDGFVSPPRWQTGAGPHPHRGFETPSALVGGYFIFFEPAGSTSSRRS